MLQIKAFTFNAFHENTYLIYDDSSGECVIIDPGMHSAFEHSHFQAQLLAKELIPTAVWLTHSHIDHVLGLAWIVQRYGIPYYQTAEDSASLKAVEAYAPVVYGIHDFQVPDAKSSMIQEGENLRIGTNRFSVLPTPGHAPGHVSFYHESIGVVAGDALFKGSIGRTDLPGGDYLTLEKSIKSQLYSLPDDCLVYPGHGPVTSIGQEKRFNPFVRA